MSRAPDPSSVRYPGPWTHRDISANGISLHVAEAGDGPLVVLLHGFAQCWWVWREHLTFLADAGYRVVAADMRGYGDSDKPPRGYDAWTLAGDVAGLVRALGARRAHLVGHGWGGAIAWTAATLHPRVVSTVSAFGTSHPLALRPALRRSLVNERQRRATGHVYRFQLPIVAERGLLADDGAQVERYLRDWSGPRWQSTPNFTPTAATLRNAVRIPGVAHSSLEYYRWAFRSLFRGDGRRFARAVRSACPVPVLQVHGVDDACVLIDTARASTRWAGPGSRFDVLSDVGHYPHLEAPDRTSVLLRDWLDAH
ncbi:MAG: alpha/beta fold hydrolase [Actinophytocola sp.]|nr:alpha/beta fold hydrolase [Actinophytocola sp.]